MTDTLTSTVTVKKVKPKKVSATHLEPARIVAAVDVTTTAISVTVIGRDGTPTVSVIHSHRTPEHAVHTVAATMHRVSIAVRAVADVITEGGKSRPAVVVMAKANWGPMNADPSAFRRAGMWWGIAAELDRLGVPTAEVPLMTAQKWAIGTAAPGAKGIAMLNDWVAARWDALPRTYGEGFRPSTVVMAAMGAMAAGISTVVPPTQDRLNTLAGYDSPDAVTRNNKAIQWPVTCKPPRTVDAWKMKEMGG